jgi:TatD DNase family protein
MPLHEKNLLIDSHCHLNYEGLRDDTEGVLRRAKKAGVHKLITVNTRLFEAKELQDIVHAYEDKAIYPHIFCSTGIHPCHVSEHVEAFSWDEIESLLRSYLDFDACIALGETGLDYYHEKDNTADQKKSFDLHAHIAVETNTPLVIHTRDAESDTIDILHHYRGKARGIFHCFTGSYALAKQALDLGFYISFSGIITFKNSKELQETVRKLPLDSLLVETDAPFLAPQPHRGKQNEPSYIVHTAQKLADLHNTSFEKITDITSKNVKDLFPLMR